MQFETKLVNGKTGIFYNNKNDRQKDGILKNKNKIKDKRQTHNFRESFDINGETDSVKTSPRSTFNNHNNQMKKQTKNTKAASKTDALTLNPDQLMSILSAIQNDGAQIQIDDKGRIKLMDTNNKKIEKNESYNYQHYSNNEENDDDFVTTVRKPVIVVADDDDFVQERHTQQSVKSNISSNTIQLATPQQMASSSSLIDKKRQKWQEDKNTQEQLLMQELNHKHKLINQKDRSSVISNQDYHPTDTYKTGGGGLSLIEKKRLKWQQEKDENTVINAGARNEYSQTTNPMKKSFSLSNLSQFETNQQMDATSLYEKKKLKWANETNETPAEWNPFGRPGGGAPNPGAQPSQKQQQQQKNFQQQQRFNEDKSSNHLINKLSMNDQSKVPAAMRTSLFFGDVMYEDDIKKTKEIERQKWLMELELQKKQKLIEKEFDKERDRLSEVKQDLELKEQHFQQQQYQQQSRYNQTSKTRAQTPPPPPPAQSSHHHHHDSINNIFNYDKPPLAERVNFGNEQQNNNSKEPKSFLRTTNHLLDPSQIDDLERKKKLNMQYQKDIEAQIEEKKRLKKLGDQQEAFENLKFENDLRTNTIKQQQQQQQHKQQYDNNRQFDESRDKENFNKPPVNRRLPVNDTNELQKNLLQSEFNAAEEKYEKLLKKLQKGGHDTSNLLSKINEFRAKYRALGVNVGFDDAPASAPPLNQRESKLDSDRSNPHHFRSNNVSILKGDHNSNNYDYEQKDTTSQNDNARIKQIFNSMRNDQNNVPTELTTEDIQMLLKHVAKNTENVTKTKPKQQQQQRAPAKETPQKPALKAKPGERPKWGYKNLEGKKAMPNSIKDPFFAEKQAEKEERQKQRLENLRATIQANMNKKQKEKPPAPPPKSQKLQPKQEYRYYDDGDEEIEVMRPAPRTNQLKNDKQRSTTTNQETIFNLLNQNQKQKQQQIYENDANNDEDDDAQSNFMPATNTQRRFLRQSNDYNVSSGKNSNVGFVPFMRTDEVLDPAHATSPCPPSREATTIKRDREKARKAFEQNMRPAEYGNYNDVNDYEIHKKMKDPLFNKNLVTAHPTPRQETLLSQLASLRKNLNQKKQEATSSMNYNDNYI